MSSQSDTELPRDAWTSLTAADVVDVDRKWCFFRSQSLQASANCKRVNYVWREILTRVGRSALLAWARAGDVRAERSPSAQMFACLAGWSGGAERWCSGPQACPRFSHLMGSEQRQRLPNAADPKQHGRPPKHPSPPSAPLSSLFKVKYSSCGVGLVNAHGSNQTGWFAGLTGR